MGKHVAALALPCPALPWQTLALPCSCKALARDTDTPLRYASLAIRQCQLWRAGCLPSELDHFARACVSPRPGMDGTAISRACPRPNVTTRQVSQMYRQAVADRAAQRRRVARRRQGARRLSAAAGRRVASTARGDCKSLGRYACMAVAYSHRRRSGGPTTAPAPYNSISHLGSACHARSVAEMGTGSPRIRLDMHCLALQLSLIKGHGSCLRSGSSNRCPALLSPLPCRIPRFHRQTIRARQDVASNPRHRTSLDLLVRFISLVGISSNSQVLLLHASAHSTFPPFNFLIGRLPLFSGRAVYFSHDDAG
jgi:hypothetical protein